MSFQIKDAAGNAITVNPIPPVGPAAKAGALPMTLAPDDPAVQHLADILLALVPVGLQYSDVSITLTTQQAAGTAAILAANPARKALVIVPPNVATLTLAGNLTSGLPLQGLTLNTFPPSICPTNQLFVRGLAAGDVVTILQA